MDDDYRGVRFSLNHNSSQVDGSVDLKKTDRIKCFKELELGRLYIATLTFSIVTFMLDVIFHCWIAYVYYKEKEIHFFAFTLVFLIVPALVSTAFSMRW